MTDATPMASPPLAFDPAFECAQPDEGQTIAELAEVFVGMAKRVHETEGHAMRAVHAKGQGLLRGHLTIPANLPPELAQGIFARTTTYEVRLRFSSPPAEQLPDSVSTPRAVAIMGLGVPGRRIDGQEGSATQDCLMVNGPVFPRPGPQCLLADSKLLALTTERMPRGKKAISAALRATESALEAVGVPSAKVKNMGGQPNVHPLGESYFTQAPFLHGIYMAKYALVPSSAKLKALSGTPLQDAGENAQREAICAFFAAPALDCAEWELQVQLCTDLEKMPIEDLSVEWPQELSPYLTVAALTLGPQMAWQGEESQRVEDGLSFDPWHAVEAHRPLGAINRARKVVMQASRDFRSNTNRCPIHEPPLA